jgi:MraZ protein
LDACLFVFPLKDWQALAARLATLPIGQQDSRAFIRLLLSGAVPVQFDSLGRILIPEYLASYAGLERQVVVAGVLSRLEIWDQKSWNIYKKKLEKDSNAIAEKLGGLGVI